MPANDTYTLDIKGAPHTFTSPFTNEEAALICEGVPRDFHQSLAVKFFRAKAGSGKFSARQMAWMHKLAVDEDAKEAPPFIAALPVICALMGTEPVVHKGVTIALKVAGEKSKYKGQIHVSDGGKYGQNAYYGRINTEGCFVPYRNSPPEVREYLLETFGNSAETS